MELFIGLYVGHLFSLSTVVGDMLHMASLSLHFEGLLKDEVPPLLLTLASRSVLSRPGRYEKSFKMHFASRLPVSRLFL